MILSSICDRTIQEVKQERDSMAFQNIQPFQPPFHHQAPANTPVSRPMSTRRNGNSRQTESLYDPPMQLPPKMWRGAASTQNLSLEDMPPSPCETGKQQQGMLQPQRLKMKFCIDIMTWQLKEGLMLIDRYYHLTFTKDRSRAWLVKADHKMYIADHKM